MYVIARNRSRRPTLQHKVLNGYYTVCGVFMIDWSRAYQRKPITELLCKKCQKGS